MKNQTVLYEEMVKRQNRQLKSVLIAIVVFFVLSEIVFSYLNTVTPVFAPYFTLFDIPALCKSYEVWFTSLSNGTASSFWFILPAIPFCAMWFIIFRGAMSSIQHHTMQFSALPPDLKQLNGKSIAELKQMARRGELSPQMEQMLKLLEAGQGDKPVIIEMRK